MKRCTKCENEYPATTKHFSTTKGTKGNDKKYLRGACRKCTNSKVHDHYHNVIKNDPARKKERKVRVRTCKLLPYSKELNEYIKTCSKCKRELPATNEYFNNLHSGSCGLHSYCKECRGHKFTPIPKEGHIICSICKDELPSTKENFLSRDSSSTGFRGVCRKCRSAQEAKFRQDNLEMMRERDRQADIKRYDSKKVWRFKTYWEDPAAAALKNSENRANNLDKRTAYSKKRYADNPKRYVATNKLWRKSEAGKASIRRTYHKRKAARKNLPHDFTVKQWILCKAHFGNVCAYCGEDTMMNHDLDQEHFIASDNYGGYTVGNIVPSCRSCNSRKHTSYFEDWYPLQPSYSAERESKILVYLDLANAPPIQQLSFAI